MPKPEMEIQDHIIIPWQPIEGWENCYEKILAKDEETGDYTRLVYLAPGVHIDQQLKHDFWEEVYVVSGSLVDLGKNITVTEGMYGCRPPGMTHGPYKVPFGCVTMEVRYYK